MQLSHVCQHWRNIAIANTLLWTHLHPQNLKLTVFCLERAKGSKLSIGICAGTLGFRCCGIQPDTEDTNPGIYDLTRVLMPNVSALWVFPVASNILQLLDIFRSYPAPSLQSITIHLSQLLADPEQMFNEDDMYDKIREGFLSQSLFLDTTPRLCQAHSFGFSPHPSSTMWNNMTHIAISFTRLEGLLPPDSPGLSLPLQLEDWFSILQRSPSLEKLEINYHSLLSDVSLGQRILQKGPVLMRKLKRISFTCVSLTEILLFLYAIDAPQLAGLGVFITEEELTMNLNHFFMACPILFARLRNLREFACDEHQADKIMVNALAGGDESQPPLPLCQLLLVFPKAVPQWESHFARYMGTLRELSLHAFPIQALPPLPRLETLYLSTPMPSLQEVKAQIGVCPLERIILPRLASPLERDQLDAIECLFTGSKVREIHFREDDWEASSEDAIDSLEEFSGHIDAELFTF